MSAVGKVYFFCIICHSSNQNQCFKSNIPVACQLRTTIYCLCDLAVPISLPSMLFMNHDLQNFTVIRWCTVVNLAPLSSILILYLLVRIGLSIQYWFYTIFILCFAISGIIPTIMEFVFYLCLPNRSDANKFH